MQGHYIPSITSIAGGLSSHHSHGTGLRPFVVNRNICNFLWYGGFARGVVGEGLRSVEVTPSPNQERVLYPARRSPFIEPGLSGSGLFHALSRPDAGLDAVRPLVYADTTHNTHWRVRSSAGGSGLSGRGYRPLSMRIQRSATDMFSLSLQVVGKNVSSSSERTSEKRGDSRRYERCYGNRDQRHLGEGL